MSWIQRIMLTWATFQNVGSIEVNYNDFLKRGKCLSLSLKPSDTLNLANFLLQIYIKFSDSTLIPRVHYGLLLIPCNSAVNY